MNPCVPCACCAFWSLRVLVSARRPVRESTNDAFDAMADDDTLETTVTITVPRVNGRLWVGFKDVQDGTQTGVLVNKVKPNSAAHQQGMEEGMRVLKVRHTDSRSSANHHRRANCAGVTLL